MQLRPSKLAAGFVTSHFNQEAGRQVVEPDARWLGHRGPPGSGHSSCGNGEGQRRAKEDRVGSQRSYCPTYFL